MKTQHCTALALAAFALAGGGSEASAQALSTLYAFTNFAGMPGGYGNVDGIGSAARFTLASFGTASHSTYGPVGLAVDRLGNVYVADRINHAIRKVTAAGVVTTFAGKAPTPGQDPWSAGGYADGVGSVARFNFPYGVAVDAADNVYVTDTANYTIRKVTPDGVVTTLAGSTGQSGSDDGSGSTARFNHPYGVAVDSAGNIYVTDSGTIRKITPDGVVTTVAGMAGVVGSADGIGRLAQFSYAFGVAVDSAGNLYVDDTGNNRITKGTRIVVPRPRFGSVSVTSDMLTATLSAMVSGTRVVLESSANLRDWLPVQTNIVSGASLPISLAIDPTTRAQFVRALVK